MLYLMIIIFTIIVGLLRGGELESLIHITIEGVYLFAASLFLRSAIWFLEFINLSIFLPYGTILLVISYFLLIFASIKNIKLPGFKYITLGILLNSFVIIVNHGKMPVLVSQKIGQNIDQNSLLENGKSIVHSLKNSGTLFSFLGDVIPLPRLFLGNAVLSVGDILIFAGIFILIQKVMMRENSQKPEIIE